MRVEVKNGNIDRAIKVLRRKLDEDGLFRKLHSYTFYEKPSDKKRRLKRAAIARGKRSENQQDK